jgi:hypothetical protein
MSMTSYTDPIGGALVPSAELVTRSSALAGPNALVMTSSSTWNDPAVSAPVAPVSKSSLS